MKPITLTIPGKPVAWQRPGLSKDRVFYNKHAKESSMFSIYVASQYDDEPIVDTPLEIELFFYMPIANKLWKKYDNRPCTTAPDVDNLVKFVFDALQGVIYKNDRVITKHSAQKIWSRDPKTVIVIKEHTYKKEVMKA